MAGVFDISVDKLDFSKIRICGHAGVTGESQVSREERTKTDLLLCVRKNTLIAFVQQCRMHNVDALHPCSLQLTILLMSKCTDRKRLCENFLSFVADTHESVEIDDGATTAIDGTESHALQSTSDWVALYSYIEVAHISESLRRALLENARVQVFVQATRHIFPVNAEIEVFVRPMLCTLLMYIPAANMLERVLLAQGPQPRDIEFLCLRGVNAYVDQCQHMPNDVTVEAISLLMRSIRVHPSFHTDIAGVVDVPVDDHSARVDPARRHFSLRRHLRDTQGATVLHRAMLFDDWKHEMKFSVNISLATQRLLYFMCAQVSPLEASALAPFFDPQMLAKTFAVSLERIDAEAVIAVIKTLRVYQYNIKDLKEFRIQCLTGFNAAVRAKLNELPIVLQLYVACWQHPSIREHCWRAILPVYNFAITSRLDEFRSKYPFEQLSVLQTLLHCHTGTRGGSALT
jgi:hypothetical protein